MEDIKILAREIFDPQSDTLREEFQGAINDLKFRLVPLKEYELSKGAAKAAATYIESALRLAASCVREVVTMRELAVSEIDLAASFKALRPDRSTIESFIYQITNNLGIPGDGNISIAMSRTYERTENTELAKLKLLAKPSGNMRSADQAIRIDPSPDFRSLALDETLRKHLEHLWQEASVAFNGGAYLSTVIMLGSLLEGALLAKCLANDTAANSSPNAPTSKGNVRPYSQWSLNDFIEVADDNQWTHKTRNDFVDTLRDYRNMVHPFNAHQRGFSVDKPMAAICWEVVKATLGDLGVAL